MFSLAIQNLQITSLGLRSLRSISGGLVLLHNNSQLCYTSSLPWENIVHPTLGPHRIVSKNQEPRICGRSFRPCPGVCVVATAAGCTLIAHLSVGSCLYLG